MSARSHGYALCRVRFVPYASLVWRGFAVEWFESPDVPCSAELSSARDLHTVPIGPHSAKSSENLILIWSKDRLLGFFVLLPATDRSSLRGIWIFMHANSYQHMFSAFHIIPDYLDSHTVRCLADHVSAMPSSR